MACTDTVTVTAPIHLSCDMALEFIFDRICCQKHHYDKICRMFLSMCDIQINRSTRIHQHLTPDFLDGGSFGHIYKDIFIFLASIRLQIS